MPKVMVLPNQYPENQVELYEKLFNLKKMIFNQKHDITIFNYEVELYVQDINEPHISTGVYSVLFNEWLVEPTKEEVNINKKIITDKVEQWEDIIDLVIDDVEESDDDLDDDLLLLSLLLLLLLLLLSLLIGG